MRKTKRGTIELGGKERGYTVLEVTVQVALDFYDEVKSEGLSLLALAEKVDGLLPNVVEGLCMEDFKKMAPSEIEAVFDDWREVNASFFKLASFLKLDQLMERLKEAIMMDFSELLCTSLGEVMLASGSMAGERS